MALCTTYGVGQYLTGEAHQGGADRTYVPAGTATPVLWFHSAGAGAVKVAATEPWLPSNNALPLLQAVARLGLPILSADCSGSGHWGNDTAQTDATAMLTFIRSSTFLKASGSKKAVLMGVSMGGLLALNWARANPTLVAAIVLFYPAVNLQAQHDGTGGATAAAAGTETAYGGSLAAFNAAVAGHDPAQHPTDFQPFPIYMGYSDADTVVGSANQSSFATAVGGSNLTPRVYSGAAHADMTKINADEVARFIGIYA